ncbi:MAG: HisA/HisF-related TIM barrel protein [Desulfobulbaceae bacterium]
MAQTCEKLGAGEILLNCIDRDGTNSGFDIELINHIRNNVTIPVIASSGAGKWSTSRRSLKRLMWKQLWSQVYSKGRKCH